jgi:origin recognition complex subunit 5
LIGSLITSKVSCINLELYNRIELPKLTKYLVIASFLASYNPARLDSRFFTKGGEGKKKVGKKGSIYNGSKKRQQLLGPKSFPLERMLAIFYSIVNENDIKSTFDIHTQAFHFLIQISTCFSLRLIIRLTSMNQLDTVKCKSNVSFAFVKDLGSTIDFEVSKYLFDFIDM